MSGMPWQMSYSASTDLDNSELQTDVMRFMAIVAFCLVAIFAIVQAMPLEPQPVARPDTIATAPSPELPVSHPRPKPAPVTVTAPPQAVTPASRPVRRTVLPAPVLKQAPRQSKPEPVTRVVSLPVTKPVAPKSDFVPAPKPPPRPVSEARTPPEPVPADAAPTADRGLSLRFESDSILRSLVERGLVSLYAIDGNDYYEMAVTAGQIDFDPGAAPAQYHEMVYETVPAEVTRMFESQRSVSARNVVWGVTLPSGTTRQLRRFVQTNFSGSLVITDDAQLALAGSGGA